MTKEVFVSDKTGKVREIWPAVKMGNERLERHSSAMSGESFVICKEHGTCPVTWVRNTRPVVLIRCCSLCVRQHCTRTTASPAIIVEEHTQEHPDGHSF